jgi:hypothetical protein
VIANGQKTKHLATIVKRMILNGHKPYKNEEDAEPFKICQPDWPTMKKIRKIIKEEEYFMPEDLLKGKNNYLYISRILMFLANKRNTKLLSELYSLHLMSNLLNIELDYDYFYFIEQIKKQVAPNSQDMFYKQIMNNDISKCTYRRVFRDKTNFDFANLAITETKNIKGWTRRDSKLERKMALDAVCIDYEYYNSERFSTVREVTHMKYDLMLHNYWHMNYPIPVETFENDKKYKEICLKCKDGIILIAQHFINYGSENPNEREGDEQDYITKKTRVKVDKRKFEREAKIGESTTDYFLMTEQMANRGNPDAALEMAQEYYFGNAEAGVPRNEERALDFYRRAADGGDDWAMANYGIMLMNSKIFEFFCKCPYVFLTLLGARNRSEELEAIRLLKKAAEKNNQAAFSALGYAYEIG